MKRVYVFFSILVILASIAGVSAISPTISAAQAEGRSYDDDCWIQDKELNGIQYSPQNGGSFIITIVTGNGHYDTSKGEFPYVYLVKPGGEEIGLGIPLKDDDGDYDIYTYRAEYTDIDEAMRPETRVYALPSGADKAGLYCKNSTNPDAGIVTFADYNFEDACDVLPDTKDKELNEENKAACEQAMNDNESLDVSCETEPKDHRQQCQDMGVYYYNSQKDVYDFDCFEPGDDDYSERYAEDCSSGELESLCDAQDKVFVRVLSTGNNGSCLSFLGLIKTLINYALLASTLIVAVMLLRGGFNYTTSRGDPAGLFEARDQIMHATIGVVLIATAYIIVLFLQGSFGFLGLDLVGPFGDIFN